MIGHLKNIGKHSLVYGTGTLLARGAGFLLIPLYTRYLSPEEYGIIALLDLAVSIAAIVLGVSIGNAIMRFYYDLDDINSQKEVISTSFFLLIPIVACGTAVLLWSSGVLAHLIYDASSMVYYLRIAFITMAFEIILSVPFTYLRVTERSFAYTALYLFRTVIALTLNIYFIAFLKIGVLGFLYSNLITGGIFCVALVLWTLANVGLSVSKHFVTQIVSFSLPLLPAGVASLCLHSADRYILNLLSTTSQVGLYDLSYKFGLILNSGIQVPFGLIWGALVYRIIKQEGGKEMVARITTYFCFCYTFLSLGIAIFIQNIVQVMASPEYYSAYKAVPFVLLGYIFFGLAGLLHLGIMVEKRTKYTLIVAAGTALINIILNFALIPQFDASNAFVAPAVVTAISFLILAMGRFYYSNKVFPITYEWKRIASLIGLTVVLFTFCELPRFEAMIAEILFKLGILFSFPFLLLLMGFWDERELDAFKGFLGRRIALARSSLHF